MSSNPCDFGMCDPSRCHDPDCMQSEVNKPKDKKEDVADGESIKESQDS